MMNIGEAAKASGVSAKMIRHYEEVALIPAAARSDSGYRLYSEADVHTLRFIRHARDLGFSIPVIGELVGLWQNRRRSSRVVRAVAQAHIQDLEQKAKDILAMKATLEHLVHCCSGDDRPDCPIIDTLAAQGEPHHPHERASRTALDGGRRVRPAARAPGPSHRGKV